MHSYFIIRNTTNDGSITAITKTAVDHQQCALVVALSDPGTYVSTIPVEEFLGILKTQHYFKKHDHFLTQHYMKQRDHFLTQLYMKQRDHSSTQFLK